MANKFDTTKRTFETRLLYIRDTFANLYDQSEIMTSCIEHKLGRNFEQYMTDVRVSSSYLEDKDPLKVLKKI